MRTLSPATTLAISTFAIIPSAALAQDGDGPGPGMHGTVYAMPAVAPDYSGSDDYRIVPFGGVRLVYREFYLQTEGTGVSANLSPLGNVIAGPAVNYRIGRRAKDIESAAVGALGNLEDAFEVGGFAGLRFDDLLAPGDGIELSAKMMFDVSDKHDGRTIETTIRYDFPLSREFALGIGAMGTYADDGYHDYYYGVTPEGAALSGLDAYDPEGGWTEVRGVLTARYQIAPRWAIVGIGSYGRLLDQAKDSPLVAAEGSADQFFGGLGVAFVF